MVFVQHSDVLFLEILRLPIDAGAWAGQADPQFHPEIKFQVSCRKSQNISRALKASSVSAFLDADAARLELLKNIEPRPARRIWIFPWHLLFCRTS